MFVTKKMFNKLLYFLGLEIYNGYIDADVSLSNRRVIDKRDLENEKEKIYKELAKHHKILLELLDRFEALEEYLNIKIEDYPAIKESWLGEKKAIIKQRFIKNK